MGDLQLIEMMRRPVDSEVVIQNVEESSRRIRPDFSWNGEALVSNYCFFFANLRQCITDFVTRDGSCSYLKLKCY